MALSTPIKLYSRLSEHDFLLSDFVLVAVSPL